MKMTFRAPAGCLCCLLLLGTVGPAGAKPPMAGSAGASFDQPADIGIGVGYSVVRFDASVRYLDKQQDRVIYLDAEGNLGLPRSDTIPVVYGVYRFSADDALGFAYFQVRRESELFAFDETLGNVRITGRARFQDQTRFFSLYYANTWYEDERSRVQGYIGLNTLDIRYLFDAEGTIAFPDGSTQARLEEEAGVTAPLPLFGLSFWFAFTPQWSISSDISLITGEYQGVAATVISTGLNARYRFSRYFGGVLGISYFDADVVIEDDETRTDVIYGFDGIYLGLHALF